MSRTLIILISIFMIAATALAGCHLMPDPNRAPWQDSADNAGPVPEPDTATVVLRWGGTLLTLTGLGVVSSRFMGVLTAPLIGGILTTGTGIAALTAADLMSRFWWIGPLVLVALIVLALIEYLNERDLLGRDPHTLLAKEMSS